PREQEGATKDGGSLEFVVQRQRQAQSQTVGGCGGSDGEDEGLPQQLGEVTGEDIDDVGEADELTTWIQQVLVEEGEAERLDQRVDNDRQQQGKPRKHQQPGEPQFADPAWTAGGIWFRPFRAGRAIGRCGTHLRLTGAHCTASHDLAAVFCPASQLPCSSRTDQDYQSEYHIAIA